VTPGGKREVAPENSFSQQTVGVVDRRVNDSVLRSSLLGRGS
jgi:hypothetical protein